MAIKALESPVGLVTLAPGAQVDATIIDDRSGKKDPITVNTPMPLNGTEYSYALPLESRGFYAKLILGKLSLRFSNTADYLEISPGGTYSLEKISPDAAAITLYFKSTKDNDILQVESWS